MTDNGDPDAITLNEDRLAAFCTYVPTRVALLTRCFLATMGMFMNDVLLSPEGKSIEKVPKTDGY